MVSTLCLVIITLPIALLLPSNVQQVWHPGQKPILIDIMKPTAATRTARNVSNVGMLQQGVLQNRFPIRMLSGLY